MTRRLVTLLAVAILAGAAGVAVRVQVVPGRAAPGAGEWRTFEGTWSVTGQRWTLPTELGREAAILHLSGAVVLRVGDGLRRGFHGEVIGFDDANERRLGRWLWTDDGGDRIFGELSGDPMATGGRIVGTITGGTGRYAGIVGDFAFTWQYVVSPESGAVAGRTTGLKGRYRRGAAAAP